MIYLWATLLVIWNLASLLGVLIGLPGVWIMVITTSLVAWWQWDEGMFSAWTLAAILALAVLGEVLEFFSGVFGSKRVGGSGWGVVGGIAGCIVGGIAGTFLIPIPLVGTLIGACVGGGLGTWLAEMAAGQKMDVAVKSGVGGGVGRLLGTLGKLLVGVVIWLIIAVAAYWP